MGVHWRIQFLGGFPEEVGGLVSLQIQGGAWQERGGGVFKRGLITQCSLWKHPSAWTGV